MHLKGNLEAFPLKSLLMGCSSVSLCRLQWDSECNIWALFLWNEMLLFCKADQKHLCFLLLQVQSSCDQTVSRISYFTTWSLTLESQVFIFSENHDNNIKSEHSVLSESFCCNLSGKCHGSGENFHKNLKAKSNQHYETKTDFCKFFFNINRV